MEYELIAIMLAAVLPVYPALFVIYQKIGNFYSVDRLTRSSLPIKQDRICRCSCFGCDLAFHMCVSQIKKKGFIDITLNA